MTVHVMTKGRCPGNCGRYTRYDANVNNPRPPMCRWCIARTRREINELVDGWVVVEKGKLRWH